MNNMEEIETVVSKMGMKILLRTENADFNPEELNNEERLGWLESLMQQVKDCTEDFEQEQKLADALRCISRALHEYLPIGRSMILDV